jgi:hypothetical protein
LKSKIIVKAWNRPLQNISERLMLRNIQQI